MHSQQYRLSIDYRYCEGYKDISAFHNRGMNLGECLCNVLNLNQPIFAKMALIKVNLHHVCVKCGRQFIHSYETQRGYSDEIQK